MRIKLNENLPVELADDLRRLGHRVDTVADEGLQEQPDPLVADTAPGSTLHAVFGQRPRRHPPIPPQSLPGIVLFRFRRVGRIAVRRRVLELLPEIERRQPLSGRLLVVSDSGVRVRR